MTRIRLPAWTGPAYRALNFNPPRGATLKSIIDYEVDVLGNEDIGAKARASLEQLGIDPAAVPAARTLWVTRTERDALAYGAPSEVRQVEVAGWLPIVDLDDEGVLVMQPDDGPTP